MLSYLEYLKTPKGTTVFIIGIIAVINVIGEILEFKGKVVPEFVKIRKYFNRKKRERQALSKIVDMFEEYRQMSDMIVNFYNLMNKVIEHYNEDNITMRDNWMHGVDKHISESEKRQSEQDNLMHTLNDKLDKNNADTLSVLIENKRSAIINFASNVADDKCLVTREQFNRIFKTYKEYEDIIEENNMTNGEVDIAYRIITEAYEKHLKNHTFVEDIRGYKL